MSLSPERTDGALIAMPAVSLSPSFGISKFGASAPVGTIRIVAAHTMADKPSVRPSFGNAQSPQPDSMAGADATPRLFADRQAIVDVTPMLWRAVRRMTTP